MKRRLTQEEKLALGFDYIEIDDRLHGLIVVELTSTPVISPAPVDFSPGLLRGLEVKIAPKPN